jgi:hypothetical protein
MSAVPVAAVVEVAEAVVQVVAEVGAVQVAVEVVRVVVLALQVVEAVALAVGEAVQVDQEAVQVAAPLAEQLLSPHLIPMRKPQGVSMRAKALKWWQQKATSIGGPYKSPARWVEVDAHLLEPLHNLFSLFRGHLLPEFTNSLKYSVTNELWYLIPPLNNSIHPIGGLLSTSSILPASQLLSRLGRAKRSSERSIHWTCDRRARSSWHGGSDHPSLLLAFPQSDAVSHIALLDFNVVFSGICHLVSESRFANSDEGYVTGLGVFKQNISFIANPRNTSCCQVSGTRSH